MFGFGKKPGWNDVLNTTSDSYYRQGIYELMIPYGISYRKYQINTEAFRTRRGYCPTFYCGCTASMYRFAEEMSLSELPKGYPDWFIIAFPDVCSWGFRTDGQKAINELITTQFDCIDDMLEPGTDKLNVRTLKMLVDCYKSKNRVSRLECTEL